LGKCAGQQTNKVGENVQGRENAKVRLKRRLFQVPNLEIP